MNMFREIATNISNQKGYSLMGIMIALAITVLLVTGITVAIGRIYDVSADRTNHIMAIREVQNAGRWFTLDGRKADTIEPAQDADGFPLTMNWDDLDENQYEVVYTLSPDNTMQREHYTNRLINPDPDATTLIASYIDLSNTSCGITENNELIANVTATVNVDSSTYTKTRTYRIFPRRSLH